MQQLAAKETSLTRPDWSIRYFIRPNSSLGWRFLIQPPPRCGRRNGRLAAVEETAINRKRTKNNEFTNKNKKTKNWKWRKIWSTSSCSSSGGWNHQPGTPTFSSLTKLCSPAVCCERRFCYYLPVARLFFSLCAFKELYHNLFFLAFYSRVDVFPGSDGRLHTKANNNKLTTSLDLTSRTHTTDGHSNERPENVRAACDEI